MRVLYLTAAFPYPLDSGHLRHYFLLRELSERHGHRVTLVSLTGRGCTSEHVAAVSALVEEVVAVRRDGGRLRAPERTRALRRAVREAAGTEGFDVAVCGKRTVRALDGVDVPVVADMCDASSARVRRALSHAPVRRKGLEAARYVAMRQAEARLSRRSVHEVYISSRDREDLRGGPAPGTTVVPNGVDLERWQRGSERPEPGRIVFTGVMSYPPNTDAALHLAEAVLPRVRERVPAATLELVGRDPPPALRAVGGRPGVTVTGRVSDVRPYLERAAVFAAPLRFGAGMQNKVLEALAMEVPVVASPLAADGLRTASGATAPLRVAEGVEATVDGIAETLSRPPAQAPAGREFAARHFSWQAAGDGLAELLSEVAARRPAGHAGRV